MKWLLESSDHFIFLNVFDLIIQAIARKTLSTCIKNVVDNIVNGSL